MTPSHYRRLAVQRLTEQNLYWFTPFSAFTRTFDTPPTCSSSACRRRRLWHPCRRQAGLLQVSRLCQSGSTTHPFLLIDYAEPASLARSLQFKRAAPW